MTSGGSEVENLTFIGGLLNVSGGRKSKGWKKNDVEKRDICYYILLRLTHNNNKREEEREVN
jgi:hypothetical protein